jgi:orotate phosphoribosyltransferase
MSPATHEEDWHSPDVVRAVAKVCLKNSEYDFVRGGHGDSYVDVDELFGDNHDQRVERALEALIKKLAAIHQRSPLRAVVFVERDSGPVGMIAARHRFAEGIDVPLLTLRPRKRIRKAALKGGQLKTGDSVAIITDVSTTGETIAEAARMILELGGRVAVAISFVDRGTGAKEVLGQMDIPLESVYPVTELQAAKASLMECKQ